MQLRSDIRSLFLLIERERIRSTKLPSISTRFAHGLRRSEERDHVRRDCFFKFPIIIIYRTPWSEAHAYKCRTSQLLFVNYLMSTNISAAINKSFYVISCLLNFRLYIFHFFNFNILLQLFFSKKAILVRRLLKINSRFNVQ